ncbi:TlpA family protein disulfide reductase [Nonlabens agnitus]|uniref:Thioredoxin domain-containing protein n=1 Tax=Nonlabens agnitus TaxID=870484 RepID=A0A2S9WUN1_9FLAO|nr:TlpA disulfide reductase family protein [Nonlabens agnitus]PRP67046.1 hypothetical protein BST86_07995 [Nonlabens agnitus]
MKLFLFIVTLILLVSCKDEKPAAIEPTKQYVNAVIIIDNQMDSIPVVIRDLPSFENSQSNILLFNNGVDTLTWRKNSDDIVRISSRINKLQTLLIKPNDTLRVQLKDSVLHITGDVVDWETFKVIETSEIDSVQNLRDQLHGRYFTKSEPGLKPTKFINDYELIELYAGGFYNRELINKELDSIAKIIALERETLDLKLEYIDEEIENKSFNPRTGKLLKSVALRDYFNILSSWSRYVRENNAIRLNPNFNELSEARDEGFLINAITDPKYMNEEILVGKYGTSTMHSYLNVLQSKYSYATKNWIKSKFHKTYFELPERLDGELLKVAKSTAIHKMMSWNEPWPEIVKCYDDYISNYGSDKYIREFEIQNAKKLNLERSLDNTDLLLANTLTKSISLTDLIKAQKGKPVYVDFWASWCPPCIDNMPASKALEKRLGDKVNFIYISIDTDEQSWKKSERQISLKAENSFIALNYELSDFVIKENLNEIPRYFIYDQSGKLYDTKAAAPDDPNIYNLLEAIAK